jgi:hypothetical protein
MKFFFICLATMILLFTQNSFATDSTGVIRYNALYIPKCLKNYTVYLGMAGQDSWRLNQGWSVYADGNNNPAPYTTFTNTAPGDPNMPIPMCPVAYLFNGANLYYVDLYVRIQASGGCGVGNCCFNVRMMTTNGILLLNDAPLGCVGDWGAATFSIVSSILWNPATQGAILPPQIRTRTNKDYGVVVPGANTYISVHP